MNESFDIVIAGGGPVGAALALGLSSSGARIALLEPRAAAATSDDARSLALAHGSRLILERLGVWPALAPALTPILHISVSQQSGFGRVELDAAGARVPALGYVVGYAALQQALAARLETAGAHVLVGRSVTEVRGDTGSATAILDTGQQLRARLIAIADGGGQLRISHVETRDYQQSALVCEVQSEQSHRNRAYERFTSGGPLALLPAARGWSLVWTAAARHAEQLAALDDREFCMRLRAVFGDALGEFSSPTQRRVFPLTLRYALRPIAPRTVLIGNAAQMLHPVAGQGFNLGLRDAWELARALAAHRADPGDEKILEKYFSQRRFDRIATILFTDSLIRLFCKDIPFLRGIRGCGLAVIDALPGAKNFLARRMMFGTRG